MEAQASYDAGLIDRSLEYNVIGRRKHKLPVRSILILLRKEADSPSLTASLSDTIADDQEPYLQFRYQVVRVWEKQAAEVLAGGLGTLPLALLCNLTSGELPQVIRQMAVGIRQEASPSQANQLWSATYV